jgi:glycosyltransferase involved in cell wall biosynthesis
MMPKISILIPVLNEERYIEACLKSILDSDYDRQKMEILVIDGMSSDRTREIVGAFARKHASVRMIDNPRKIVPVAMNIGIRQASGEYIVRLDAHAAYPRDYFSKLIAWHQRLDADNVGAVIRTEVKHPTPKSNAIAKVLSSKFGVGNSDFRVGVDRPKEVDTVPFGCYRKEVFEQYGYYDERLVRNQDIELNKRILSHGGKIYLVPDVECTYYARENFTDLAKNNFANGKWNILTAYYTKTLHSLSLRHFVPFIFVLSLILPTVGAFLYPKLLFIPLISLISYMALVIIISLKLKDSMTNIFDLAAAFMVLHLSYGIGSLAGLIEVLGQKIKGKHE